MGWGGVRWPTRTNKYKEGLDSIYTASSCCGTLVVYGTLHLTFKQIYKKKTNNNNNKAEERKDWELRFNISTVQK